MGALLHQPALVHHQDLVRRQNGAQTVGDHQTGAALHHALQRLLDQRFALGVEVAGGLVQDQDARVFEDDPRDGHPLLLAAGEPVPPLADDRVIAIGQLGDEVVDVGGAAGGLQFGLRRIGPGIEQVGADGVVEEVGLLGHHADIGRQGGQRDVAQIVAVQRDPALGRIVQARQQIGDGRLARAAGADQRHQLARLDLKADVAQRPAQLWLLAIVGVG